MAFDLKAAKKAGATDKEIADFLAKKKNFNIVAAREAGGNDEEISKFLATGKKLRDVSNVGVAAEGLSRGAVDLVSTIAGAPVDLVTGAINFAGGLIDDDFEIKKPFAGSESIRSGLSTGFEAIGTPIMGREDLPASQQPLAIGAEVLGGIALPAAAPFAAAKGIGFLKPVVAAAQAAPKSFIASEVASGLGSAAGAAGAELFDPDDPVTRFIGEVVGGFFSPISMGTRALNKVTSSADQVIKSFSKLGRKSKAAEIIQDIVEESGEDPKALAELLSKADVGGALTSGQKTGSPALLAIEKKLAESSHKFSGEAEGLVNNSMKQLRELADNFTKSGDPQALKVAAKLKQRYFDDLLTRRIEIAGQEALEARAALGTDTKADIKSISVKAQGILKEALKDARTVERGLWEKIPKDIPTDTKNLLNAVADVTERHLLPSENLPTLVQNEITRMLDGGTTTGEMLKFRSRLLKLSREASHKGNFNDKAIFDGISDGILDDLSGIADPVIDDARGFTRMLHEKFSDTFAGDALASSSGGGQKISPELMLERAFGSGGTRGDVQFRELQDAANFPNELFGKPLLSEQEKFLQIASKEVIDNSGRVNVNKLQNFVSKNEGVLERFPDLKAKLSTAEVAEESFKAAEHASKVATSAINKRSAFANLLKTDNPVTAIGDILTKKDSVKNFNQMAKLARSSGEGAVGGLRSSALQAAFDKSTNAAGDFSFEKFGRILSKGFTDDGKGLVPMMLQGKIMDKATANRLKVIISRATDIEGALKSQKKLNKLIDDPDPLFDMVTRIVGAKIGTAGAAGSAGSGLIAASAGSKFARNIMAKVPANKISEVLEEAALNPKFMAMLLRKPKTIKQANELKRQINAFLINAGIQEDEE